MGAAARQKRRAQQLKKWAQYEQDLQHRKRKHEAGSAARAAGEKVSFEASVALLEASLRNDAEEGRPLLGGLVGGRLGLLDSGFCAVEERGVEFWTFGQPQAS